MITGKGWTHWNSKYCTVQTTKSVLCNLDINIMQVLFMRTGSVFAWKMQYSTRRRLVVLASWDENFQTIENIRLHICSHFLRKDITISTSFGEKVVHPSYKSQRLQNDVRTINTRTHEESTQEHGVKIWADDIWSMNILKWTRNMSLLSVTARQFQKEKLQMLYYNCSKDHKWKSQIKATSLRMKTCFPPR